MIITLSGLDGSGKSTIISRLKAILERNKHPVAVRSMYFHLSFYSIIRSARDKVFFWKCSESREKTFTYNLIPNLGRPDVSDKSNMVGRLVYGCFRSRLLRSCSLFGDLIIFYLYRLWEERIQRRILIIDRYFYDSLADVVPWEGNGWHFVRFFLKFCPKPDLAVLVDVPPETAYERKREYPLDYLRWRRDVYKSIFGYLENPLILENQNLERATERLNAEVIKRTS